MRLLAAYGEAQRDWPAELWAAYGMLQLRLTHPAESEAALLTAADLLRRGGRSPELIRVLMHAGGAALKCGDPDRAVKHLHEALFEMLRLKLHAEFRPDFEELQELLYHALLDPDTAPLLAPLLDNLAHLALPQGPRPMNSRSHLQLHTLGRTAVFCGGERVELNLRGSALLLGYLTLHPDQTRAQLQLALYPDKEENTGAGYIRSAVAQLRETLGPDVIVTSGPRNAPKYRLGPDVACDFDVVAFRAAARAGELRRMLGVYRGAFLQGIEDSPWVRDVREELLATLSLACHAELERLQDAREWRRLILLANRLLSLDPHDTRALELRMQAAEAGGNVQERASYAVEFRRSLN